MLNCYRKSLKGKSQTRKTLTDFCESTSLHGYNYVHNANSKGLKITWMLVILLMTGLGVFFLSKQTAEFMEARIVTNIETSTASLKVIWKHLLTYSHHSKMPKDG